MDFCIYKMVFLPAGLPIPCDTEQENTNLWVSCYDETLEGHRLNTESLTGISAEKRAPLFLLAWQVNTVWRRVCVCCALGLTGPISQQRFTASPCHLGSSVLTWCLVNDPNVKCICAWVCVCVWSTGQRRRLIWVRQFPRVCPSALRWMTCLMWANEHGGEG